MSTSSAKTVKLRLTAWDHMSKTEVCSHQNAPTLDLTLKLRKRWCDVMDYLSKKWGKVSDLQNRLQIFFVQDDFDHGVDCLADPTLHVGRSLGNHPALVSSSSSVIPVVELYYHLRPVTTLTSVPNSSPRSTPRPQSFESTDPTLQATCELANYSTIPPPHPRDLPPPQLLNGSHSIPPQSRKRPLSPEGHPEQKTRRLNPAPPLSSGMSSQIIYQSGPLEILNLPLFLNQNSPSSFLPPPPPLQKLAPAADWCDGVEKIGSFGDDGLHQDSNLQLAFIRDGLQAIADSPLSSLPPLDGTIDVPGHAPQIDHLELSHQFSSDTIAHFIDVMQEGEAETGDPPPTKGLTLEGFAEKVSRHAPSSCGSDSELSNLQVPALRSASYAASSLSSLAPPAIRLSPDQGSQGSVVESETIQDSEDSSLRPQQQQSQPTLPSGGSNGDGGSQSRLSIGIPRAIMRRSSRKPHLRRINPTLIGPLSGPSTGLWG
jgi:hypothetical protein